MLNIWEGGVVDLEQLKKWGAYGPVVVAYAFGLSLIYIYTYWDLFGIDVLQWVDFGDVIELGLAQLTVLFVGFAFCALMIWVVIAPILGWPFLIEELDESDKALRMRALDYVVGAISFVGGMVLLLGTTAPLWGAFLLSAAVSPPLGVLSGCAPYPRPPPKNPRRIYGWMCAHHCLRLGTQDLHWDRDRCSICRRRCRRTPHCRCDTPQRTDGELKILGIVHHDRLFVLKDSLRVEERSVIAVPLANLSSIQIRQAHRG